MRTKYINEKIARKIENRCSKTTSIILQIMRYTGFRVGDVVSLTDDNIDVPKSVIEIREQKTDKIRKKSIPTWLLNGMLYQKYSSPIKEYSKYVFPSLRNNLKHRTRSSVEWAVKRACIALGLGKRINTHSWRKLYAVNMIRKGKTLVDVKKDLNHDKIDTTVMYAYSDKIE